MPSLRWLPVGLVEVLLLAITVVRSCQLGLRRVGQPDGEGIRQLQLQLLPGQPGCQCGSPTLYLLICGTDGPCDHRQLTELNSPTWLRVGEEQLAVNQTIDVFYAGWYSVRSERCPQRTRLWVDGLSATAWNVSMTVELEQTDGETRCFSVLVTDQWDTPMTPCLAFPQLTLCMKEVGDAGPGRDPRIACRTAEYPQGAAERLCLPPSDLRREDKYELRVSPFATTLCKEYLPGCPYRSRILSVAQLLGPVAMAAGLPPADTPTDDSGRLTTYCLGAVAVVVAVVAAALFVQRCTSCGQRLRSEAGINSKKALYLYLHEAEVPSRTDPSDPTCHCELTSQI